jgi:hypothetical protein
MAHIELGHLGGSPEKGGRVPDALDLHPTVSAWFRNGISFTALQEFDADARALLMCLNRFGFGQAYHLEGCMMMIFRLFRYILWLEMALRQGIEVPGDFLFGARASQIRKEIESYGPEIGLALIKYLDWLETTMEPGALDGMELYKNVLTEPRDPPESDEDVI